MPTACADKHCRVVTVIGEAGIGKTAASPRGVRGAPTRNLRRCSSGVCVSYGRRRRTYLPIGEIVRQAAGGALARRDPRTCSRVKRMADSRRANAVAELVGASRNPPSGPGEAFLGRAPVARVDRTQWARRGRARRQSTGRSRRSSISSSTSASGAEGPNPRCSALAARGTFSTRAPGVGAGRTSTGFLVRLEPLPEEALGVIRGAASPAVQSTLKSKRRIVEHSGWQTRSSRNSCLLLPSKHPSLGARQDHRPTLEAILASRPQTASIRESLE